MVHGPCGKIEIYDNEQIKNYYLKLSNCGGHGCISLMTIITTKAEIASKTVLSICGEVWVMLGDVLIGLLFVCFIMENNIL